MTQAHSKPTRKPTRFYSPDYRRQLRDAGAFRGLSPSAHIVLAALCDRANAAGVAWPTVETIARDYGIGASSVRRALNELTAAGLVIVLRRSGKQNRYHLITPATLINSGTGVSHDESSPSQIESPPLPNRDPNMTNDHFTDHDQEQQHGDAPATDVVDSATHSPRELPAIAEGEGDAIQLLPEDLRERLKAAGLHPARVNRYGADRVRWVLEALDTERKRKQIVNPAGWVVQALKDNWDLPPGVVQRALPFAEVAAKTHAPPEGTRWGRHRITHQVLEVADVNDTRAQFVGGFNAPAVPSHLWRDWEWFTECPDSGESPVIDDDDLFADVDLDPAKAEHLARVAAWATIKRRDERALNDKLEACGLTFEDWEAHQAVQVLRGLARENAVDHPDA